MQKDAGPTLAKYQPLRTIASDDHSSDKVCLDRLTGKHVLIRRTSKRYLINNSLVNNLDLQVKLFQRTTDRCWLRPLEFLQNLYFTYEVYESDENATSLTDLIEMELTDKEIRYLGAQLLRCIESLHAAGYYSGCLSPRSFVLCGDGIVRLSSLMHVKPIETTRSKERRKTAFIHERHLFMAPEMVDQMADEGPSADYWTLGIILYHFYHELEPFTLADFDSPARLVSSIELDEKTLSKDAIAFLRSLLRRHYDRMGRNNPQEVKRHTYFTGTDWKFSKAFDLMKVLLRQTEKQQVPWKELYFNGVPTSTEKDNVYFPSFAAL